MEFVNTILTFDFATLPIWMNVTCVVLAVLLMAVGADMFVDGAVFIARKFEIDEGIIGLTIVAWGTSAPELAVSVGAAFNNLGSVALGNVVGSSIFNVALILGGCAMIRPILSEKKQVYRDGGMYVFAASLVAFCVLNDGFLSRSEGGLLLLAIVMYLAVLFKNRKKDPDVSEDVPLDNMSMTKSVGYFFLGLSTILIMAHILVHGSSAIAKNYGVSDWLISVTVVAAGTSMPEFVTSFVGILKGRAALAAGSIIGSELMNLLGVLGIAAVLAPFQVAGNLTIPLAALVGTAVLLLVFLRTKWTLSRFEGAVLVLIGLSRWAYEIVPNL